MNTQNNFSSRLIKQHPRLPARVMEITTPHGAIQTPAFMPVGTRAAVNCMTALELEHADSQIILGGNTYHMLLAPGLETIQQLGGMHRMMNWQKPMLTDSGGYQVFSLSKNKKLCTIDEEGAVFKHPHTNEKFKLTPATSIHAQNIIGADIIMAFDQCTPEEGGREIAEKAMERTHRWLLESIEAHQKSPHTPYGHKQALFGIVQGGSYQDLREQGLAFTLEQPLDGIAIGGEMIGYDMEKTDALLSWLAPLLPVEKPRYTMGVGLRPSDLITVVKHGIDMFDCVAPTRNARHGCLYSGLAEPHEDWVRFNEQSESGRILIKKAIYAHDDQPIVDGCPCYTCQHHSRGYLHYLFKQQQALYHPLACIHNITIMHQVCSTMRQIILESA